MNESHAAARHVRSNDRDARDVATSSDNSMLAALKNWKDWGRDAQPSARNNRGVGGDATGSPHKDARSGSGQQQQRQKHNAYLLNGDSNNNSDDKFSHQHTAARVANRKSGMTTLTVIKTVIVPTESKARLPRPRPPSPPSWRRSAPRPCGERCKDHQVSTAEQTHVTTGQGPR